jgi:hypothetical protein
MTRIRTIETKTESSSAFFLSIGERTAKTGSACRFLGLGRSRLRRIRGESMMSGLLGFIRRTGEVLGRRGLLFFGRAMM